MEKLNKLVTTKIINLINLTEHNSDFEIDKLEQVLDALLGDQEAFYKRLQLSYVIEIVKNNNKITLIDLLQTLAEAKNANLLAISLIAKEILANTKAVKQLMFLVSPNTVDKSTQIENLNWPMPLPINHINRTHIANVGYLTKNA